MSKRKRGKKKYISSKTKKKNIEFIYKVIICPKNLSLFHNIEGFILFINKLKSFKNTSSRFYSIYLDLTLVEEIDESSITILLSVIEELKNDNIRCEGNVPISPYSKSILEHSGFFEHVKDINNAYVNNIRRTKNYILKQGKNTIDSQSVGSLVKDCVYFLTNTKDHFSKLYTVLMEVIPNTLEHV